MGWYGACWTSGAGWVWLVVGMFTLAALAAAGAWLVARLTPGEPVAQITAETPRQALGRRLGTGEISADEYLLARQLLEDDIGPAVGNRR